MKRLFFLLYMLAIACSGFAQRHSMAAANCGAYEDYRVDISAIHRDFIAKHMGAATGAEKGTGWYDRWYDYGIYMDAKAADDRTTGAGVDYIYGYSLPIWNDTFGIINEPSGIQYNNMLSAGSILYPQFSGFNRYDFFPCPTYMHVEGSNMFAIDSIVIIGFYNYGSKATPGLVDTLRLSFLTGDGTPSSNIFGVADKLSHYGTGFTYFVDVAYDSINNVAVGVPGGTKAQYMDVLLTNADTGYYDKAIAIRNAAGAFAPITVPAGDLIACTVTFKSGQPGIFTSLPGDTLIGAVPPYTRYNMFRPVVDYYTLTDSSKVTTSIPYPDWPPYSYTDYNIGVFKNSSSGFNAVYQPTFSWDSITASIYQYPEIAYHITCPTCICFEGSTNGIIIKETITATPNPANDELNFQCSFSKPTDAVITITNMLGQVVATQYLKNITAHTCVFNIAAFAPGIYLYNIQSNEGCFTGHIAITH